MFFFNENDTNLRQWRRVIITTAPIPADTKDTITRVNTHPSSPGASVKKIGSYRSNIVKFHITVVLKQCKLFIFDFISVFTNPHLLLKNASFFKIR